MKNRGGIAVLLIFLCGSLLAAVVWAVFPRNPEPQLLEFTSDRWREASEEQRGCMVDSLMLQYDRLSGMTQEDVAGLLGGNGECYSLGPGRHFMEGIRLYIVFDQNDECKGSILSERNHTFYENPAIPFSRKYSLEEYHPFFDAIQVHRKSLDKKRGSGF